mgnify:CR=1 FL=1
MKVAIPHHAGEVSPCFEYSARIAIFTIRGGRVAGKIEFALQSKEAFDRIRLLRDQGVSVLICGGLQDAFEGLLRACGIKVYSWVAGTVDELLGLFLSGRLVSGTARLGMRGEDTAAVPGHKRSAHFP